MNSIFFPNEQKTIVDNRCTVSFLPLFRKEERTIKQYLHWKEKLSETVYFHCIVLLDMCVKTKLCGQKLIKMAVAKREQEKAHFEEEGGNE